MTILGGFFLFIFFSPKCVVFKTCVSRLSSHRASLVNFNNYNIIINLSFGDVAGRVLVVWRLTDTAAYIHLIFYKDNVIEYLPSSCRAKQLENKYLLNAFFFLNHDGRAPIEPKNLQWYLMQKLLYKWFYPLVLGWAYTIYTLKQKNSNHHVF